MQLTVAEDRGRYCGLKGDPDVRLECSWDTGDLEVERSAFRVPSHGTTFSFFNSLCRDDVVKIQTYDVLHVTGIYITSAFLLSNAPVI